MKKILSLILISTLVASCTTPLRIEETITTDNAGHSVRTIKKYYDSTTNRYYEAPRSSVNIVTSPFWYNGIYYPYYNTPSVVVPIYTPVYRQSGRRH